ncbi:dienelactone hydrolase family protein [Corynebacterium flavescens]|uniref:dienelactone hydrolase family protein n=1 Tax=Corynebacterium flavescens TaxID=28028 RepID=UPI000EC7BBF7|nr:dienelactone hydrolase family protein [Corynebacterium flavescens]MDN6647174.1 dienelactone hydrolase family protein [Corynebacterium flavescens]HCG47448.1 alpha/beta hydrolase [Corynebacterium flavescens]
MTANLKKHLSILSKRGPHRVLIGDLDYAGLAGKVYTPAEGKALPAVAFGHDWTKKIKSYHATLRHLASWGIVVVAPNTETGVVPNHRNLAADMESALQIAAGVKLGSGKITVSPHKLGMIGHGMGGGAAVLAAANNDKVKAVAAIYPATTSPSSTQAARSVKAPGLVIGSKSDDIFGAGNPAKLAASWGGSVAYREVYKGNQQGFSEDTLFKLTVGAGFFQAGARDLARGLLTGFLLDQLASESKYDGFASPLAAGKGFSSYSGDALSRKAGLLPSR